MGEFSPLDGLVLAIVMIALARGFFIGLIREGFSIAALAGSCLTVRYLTTPTADWLVRVTGGELASAVAPWVAGALLAIASLAVISIAGRVVLRGVRAVGLGWVDRLGGCALGAAEGALVATLLVLGATWCFGNTHPIVTEARSTEVYQEVQAYVKVHAGKLPIVAAPLGR